MSSITTTANDSFPNRRICAPQFKPTIVWLSKSVDTENITGFQGLCDVQEIVRPFSDCDRCAEFVADLQIGEHVVFFVISTSLAQDILPLFHELPQIDSIFIFGNTEIWQDDEWCKKWRKLKGIYKDVASTCAKLMKYIKNSLHGNNDHDEFTTLQATSFTNAKNDAKQHQEAVFMYCRILYVIFSEMEVNEYEADNFIDMCRTEITGNQAWINEFERDYTSGKAIWWYTRSTYLYSMLNEAFRTQNIRVLFTMNFLIRDLYRRLEELHSKALISGTISVYRGQNMKRSDFEHQIKNNIGGLLSITTFWSTSRDPNVAHMFLGRQSDKAAVIFHMSVDSTLDIDRNPFADIHEESAMGDEDEVLFSVGTVFRIVQVEYLDDGDIWKVSLTLTTDADEQLSLLTNQIVTEISGSTGYHRLGKLMCLMGKWDDAFEIYDILLEKIPDDDHPQLAHIHNQLGYICDKNTAFTEALDHYQQSLRYSSANDVHTAAVYNNMGIIYFQRKDLNRALDHFQRSLEIEMRVPSPNQQNIATRLSNIGGVLKEEGKLKEALSNFERAIDIQRAHLSPIHPSMAILYNNIGTIYFEMKKYSAALFAQRKTLEIQHLSLPPNHPSLATIHCNVASTLEALGQYEEAVQHVLQAVEILRCTFPPDHPNIQGVQRGLENLLRRKNAQ